MTATGRGAPERMSPRPPPCHLQSVSLQLSFANNARRAQSRGARSAFHSDPWTSPGTDNAYVDCSQSTRETDQAKPGTPRDPFRFGIILRIVFRRARADLARSRLDGG